MLYYLQYLQEWFSPLRVFRYITVRALVGAGIAFLVSLLLGPAVIRYLRQLKVSQVETREHAEALHALREGKRGTPTMGGLLIILAITFSTLMTADLSNGFVSLALSTLWFLGLVGFWDDYRKVVGRNTRGMRGRAKLLLQAAWAVMAALVMLHDPDTADSARQLMVPFVKDPVVRDLGIAGTCLFVALVVVGASNAVNLTDGLDGLAIGCTTSVALAYLAMAYIAGHVAFASYLMVPYVPGAGELAVFCGCMAGASLGFLWYNCHPAAIFMGDTGSLALGGTIGMVAALINQEIVLVLVGGVFVLEALSVMLQVASFKLRGKRVFAMAPLHHGSGQRHAAGLLVQDAGAPPLCHGAHPSPF